MGSHSMFKGTIADMTWPRAEETGRSHLPMLLRVPVIERW